MLSVRRGTTTADQSKAIRRLTFRDYPSARPGREASGVPKVRLPRQGGNGNGLGSTPTTQQRDGARDRGKSTKCQKHIAHRGQQRLLLSPQGALVEPGRR